MTKERTFLHPLNDSADLIRDCKDDLAALARALHTTGNSTLADKLAAIGVELSEAIKLLSEGRDMALRLHLYGAEAATKNMVDAAIAAVQR